MQHTSAGAFSRHPDLALRELEQSYGNRWRSSFPGKDLGPFHLAYLQERLCLFHRGSLAVDEPAAWAALEMLARELGAALVVDRRERQEKVGLDRRRLALALTVTAGLLARIPTVAAETLRGGTTTHEVPTLMAEHSHAPSLALALPAARKGIASRAVERTADGKLRIGQPELSEARRLHGQFGLKACTPPEQAAPCVAEQPVEAARIASILLGRLADDTPSAVRADIAKAAGYYSQHPEVRDLIQRLSAYEWNLRYSPGTWLTESKVRGDKITRVTVRFDLNTAATMHFARGCRDQPACTAMPADALLHELLHVYLIATDPSGFLRSARASYYPHSHEQEVISMENRLYRVMEARDGLPRPARHSHDGQLSEVDCPLCWRTVAENP